MSVYRLVPNPSSGDASETIPEDHDSIQAAHEDDAQPHQEIRKRRQDRFSWLKIRRARASTKVKKGWKPISMTPPILVSFSVVSLLLAACIECLAQRSSANGGLALSTSIRDIPRVAMMTQKYVPIVLATLYSMVWTWVDQDVKRMQPWFELSKPQGARGEDSLFLSYPHDFFLIVLYKAARKRHWSVFLSGSMMVVILLLTPLQPSVMGVGTVVQKKPIHIVTASDATSSLERRYGDLLLQAYTIKKFQQPLPLFTTNDYALLPFFAEQDAVPSGTNVNITATTVKFWTELTCWQPKYLYMGKERIPLEGKDQGAPITIRAKTKFFAATNTSAIAFSISDDDECALGVSFLPTHDRPFGLFYGAESMTIKSWSPVPGANSNACQNHTSLLGLMWTKWLPRNNTPVTQSEQDSPIETDFEFTGRICRRDYYKQDFRVTIAADDSSLHQDSLVPAAERLELTESEFKLYKFEQDLLLRTEDSNIFNRSQEALSEIREPPPGLSPQIGGPRLIQYLFFGQDLPVSQLSDPSRLVNEFDRLEKFLFSLTTTWATFELSGIIVISVPT
ncbi:hypothetical protein CDD81_1773 [Ophiocordyceps australis]|uniref:Uncharacterized protein n=1 Tax=Ophiocordyceps australis TaxID=1399860 RepID=A0A2C5YAF4_9HYPO|nr:hypothetical protein CDD81_1773 [Ophiocordyceps australis]